MKKITSLYLCAIIIILSLTACSQKRMGLGETKYTSAARHKATMKSYNVMGKRYHPGHVSKGQVQRGISSWYGPNFHGKYTSNGEIYDMYARTAAHKTWPMDTMVRVSNVENGKSTVVRINDRGPFVKGRIIDCSYKAGKEIGLDKMGIAKVKVEVLGFAGNHRPKVHIAKQKKSHTPIAVAKKSSGFALQVGSFGSYSGATKNKNHYSSKYLNYRPIIKSIPDNEGIISYRVWLMGFNSEQEARDFKEHNDIYSAFIVRT